MQTIYICDNCKKEMGYPKVFEHKSEEDENIGRFEYDLHFCSEDCKDNYKEQ